VELNRFLLAGRGELYATVAGTVAGERDRWLGRTAVYQIDLSPPHMPDVSAGGELPVVWRDFGPAGGDQDPNAPALPDEVAYLDLNNSKGPTIYLNDKPELRRLLDDRTGRSALERSTRDLVFDMIAQSALIAMFNAALAAAIEIAEDGVPQLPG